ncbi:Nucleolar complex protein 2 [Branchiostoma belcheri]|nr:Nucleolar complex protein 2 [Branchiostoma belcheri]
MAASVKKRKLSDLSVDDFMAHGFDEDSEEEVDTKQEGAKKGKKKQKKTKGTRVVKKVDKKPTPKAGAPDVKKKGKETPKHKMQMSRLQEVDPEFYQFLQKEDKDLLDRLTQ